MVSATTMKSYCLCSSDPEKSHRKKMKGNLFKDQYIICDCYIFSKFFLSALLTPVLRFCEEMAMLGCYFGGVCSMLVGLQICREVIFQVIEGDF